MMGYDSMNFYDTHFENPVRTVAAVARSVAWPQWTWESSFLHGLAGLWYRVAMRGRNVIQPH